MKNLVAVLFAAALQSPCEKLMDQFMRQHGQELAACEVELEVPAQSSDGCDAIRTRHEDLLQKCLKQSSQSKGMRL